ncbi:protein kinase domain-containing protein [Nocardiopsis sp. NPDC055551]|uniref:serine/threonine-protein kinase n=1 Tax=Nocardiopsis sp. NPDC006832 TaxID=3157188 RepID=UPI0033E8439D
MSTSPTPAEEPTPGPHHVPAVGPDHPPEHPKGLPPGLDPLTETDPPLIGRYRLVGRIGAGGMGVVYAGLDSEDRCIALKTVHAKYADRPGHREAFAREVQMLRRADGISTARVHGADPTAPVPWLAFDYVPGRDLRRHVREFGPLPADMLRTFALGTAEGLAALHAAGIAHRDIKPGNVILAPDGPKIVDFGIAIEIGTDPGQDASASYGTPGWTAPERYAGAVADPAADVFAWGGLVALAATGRSPFGKGSPAELAERVKAGDHDIEGVPEGLLPLVEGALSVAPLERPAAVDLLAALLPVMEVENVDAGTAPAPDRARTQRVLRAMLADYWRGVDMAGHDPSRWAVALGTASAVGLGAVGTGTVGSGALGSGAAGTASGMAAGGAVGGGAAGGGGMLGALSGVKGIMAVLGTLTLVGTGAAAGAWYLRDEEPVEETVVAEEENTLAVEADPEDGEAVLAEAFTLALEADSFTGYRLPTHNDAGPMRTSYHMYTREPERLMLEGGLLGPGGSGVLAGGEDLDDRIYFSDIRNGISFGDPIERHYSRVAPGPSEVEADLHAEWANQLNLFEEILDQETEIAYTGRSATDEHDVPDSFVQHDLLERLDPGGAEFGREGHHYTGTVVHEFDHFENLMMLETEFEIWVSDEGYPMGYYVEAEADEPTRNSEEMLALTRTVRFYRFDQPVEIEYPEEHEIS